MKFVTVATLAAAIGGASAQLLDPINATGNYNQLLLLLTTTSNGTLVDSLESFGPFTIFGPNDAAFAPLADTLSNITDDEGFGILAGHVIAGNVTAEEIITVGCIEADTLAGGKVSVKFDSATSVVSVNGITVSEPNIFGEYGVFHGIDQVMVPGVQGDFVPCPPFEADFSPIADKGIYSDLLEAAVSTGADAAISSVAPVTILGPKNSAFAPLEDAIKSMSPEELNAILLNHVIEGPAYASDIAAVGCIEATAVGGLDIAVRYNATTGVIDANGIIIDDTDIQGNFGVMHGMNGVLGVDGEFVPCPIKSFVEQVALTGEYETLVGVLQNPLLQQALESVQPVTVFGPDDIAFEGVDLESLSPAEVQQTLGGHVVSGYYSFEDVKKAGCVLLDTIVGTKIRVMYMKDDGHDHDHDHMDGGRRRHRRRLGGHLAEEPEMGFIMVNDAEVIFPDVFDETNIFHGIDSILTPGTFECPSEAPKDTPTTPPAGNATTAPATNTTKDDKEKESSASIAGFSAVLAAVVAISALAF